jgi:hypothetical protein
MLLLDLSCTSRVLPRTSRAQEGGNTDNWKICICIIQNYLSFNTLCLLQDSNIERVILVSPKFGISQITGLRNSVVSPNTLQNPNVHIIREKYFSC